MTRRTVYLLAALALMAAGLINAGQDPPAVAAKSPLAFEVATIKPADPSMPLGGGIHPLPGNQTYNASSATLRTLIVLMYRITNAQLVGGPDWVNKDRYDIQAKAAKPASIEDLHVMFQTLLADRFKLQFHREMRTVTTLTLVVDKPGKMKRNEDPESFDIPIKPTAPFKSTGTRVSMTYLSWYLSQAMDRPVIDGTGLPGFYDFTLAYLPDLPPGVEYPPDFHAPDVPNIYQALKEQLGLKLESQKGQVEFFVIDHAEKPTGN